MYGGDKMVENWFLTAAYFMVFFSSLQRSQFTTCSGIWLLLFFGSLPMTLVFYSWVLPWWVEIWHILVLECVILFRHLMVNFLRKFGISWYLSVLFYSVIWRKFPEATCVSCWVISLVLCRTSISYFYTTESFKHWVISLLLCRMSITHFYTTESLEH